MRKNCQRSAGIGCRFPETLNEKGGGSVARWLWIFWIYSFLGYGLEKVFAAATHSPNQGRKCFLLLPLCPVYGLGALMIRGLVWWNRHPLWVMAAGFLAATTAELLMGAIYRYGLRVEFWDYSRQPRNLFGLVCLRFSFYWMVLAVLMVYKLDPLVEQAAGMMPGWLDAPAAILTGTDLAVSAVALRRSGTTEVLRWYR